MKVSINAFKSDIVEFTWLDIVKLILGKEIKDGALIARRQHTHTPEPLTCPVCKKTGDKYPACRCATYEEKK
jgi:hypothetical protein